MVTWAKENAAASGLSGAPIRWLVDDCVKFVEREIRRGNHYDAIIMDPPSYGRGPKGEIWKIEDCIHACTCSADLYAGYRAEAVEGNRGITGDRTSCKGDRTGTAMRSFRTLEFFSSPTYRLIKRHIIIN